MEMIFFIFLILTVLGFLYKKYFSHDPSFVFVVLADTQTYTAEYPEIFMSQVSWIKENYKKLHIQFVSHVGDIVYHNAQNHLQWEIASKCMNMIEGVVPYGILPGNHDSDYENKEKITFKKYNEIFSPKRFSKFEWYGGNYLGNQNSFQLIEIESSKFIIMNLQIDPSDDVLQWANTNLKQYSDRMAIVVTHAYIYDDISYRSDLPYYGGKGNSGEDIWHKCIKNNCNVFLVLSGHYHTKYGENYIKSKNKCGKVVHQIVQNYQHVEKGQSGYLRMYKFIPSKKKIKVSTYSPYKNQYKWGRRSNFTINY